MSDFAIPVLLTSRTSRFYYSTVPYDPGPLTAPALEYNMGTALPTHYIAPPMPMIASVVSETNTVILADLFGVHGRDVFALFTLEHDEDGDMVFADTSGAMYGLGPDFAAAIEDWFISARELRTRLTNHVGSLHSDLQERLQFLDKVLAERPALARPQ